MDLRLNVHWARFLFGCCSRTLTTFAWAGATTQFQQRYDVHEASPFLDSQHLASENNMCGSLFGRATYLLDGVLHAESDHAM